jgi:hypothetical protein
VLEIREEGEHLREIFLLNDLNASQIGFPFLVDRNHAAAARDDEGGGDPDPLAPSVENGYPNLPIVKDLEASHGSFEGMEI